MGLTTIAYSITEDMLKKIKSDNENLAFVFGECEKDEIWDVEQYDFDSDSEVYSRIFRRAGFEKASKNIDSEYFYDDLLESSYTAWIITSSEVKAMVEELNNVTFADLKAKSKDFESPATDRRGNILPEDILEGYFSSIEVISAFFKKTAEQGNALVFGES